MVEVTILIPLASNEGDTFTSEHHLAFERAATRQFGGVTRLPGEVAGKWASDGQVYTDRLVAYVIALETILDAGKLRPLLTFARQHYKQKTIYLRYLGVAEIV